MEASAWPNPSSRYRANLQGEIDSAALYRTLAAAEKDPKIQKVYERLAAVEESHAEFWRKRIRAGGQKVPDLAPDMRSRILGFLARRFGPQFVLPTINTLEHLDSGQYDLQPDAVAGGLPNAERSHARIVEALAKASPGALTGSTLAQLEGRHRGMSGNALRAAVLGANDGLVSNLSLVMGVAGAALSAHLILITGLAGLLAGACSMAMGEWLSVNTAREANQRQIDVEATELEEVPDEEKEELSLIYQSKGVPEDQAKALAETLITNKETALDTLTREELGIDPDEPRRFGVDGGRHVVLSLHRGRDFPGGAVLLSVRRARRARGAWAERSCAVPDRRRDEHLHRPLGPVFRRTPIADRLRRRRRHLRRRPRHRRDGRRVNALAKAV